MADVFKLDGKKMGVSKSTDKYIENIVKEQLNLISKEIKNAHDKDNLSSITYNVPYMISVSGLKLGKAQLHVYYQIVKTLTDKNFQVLLDIDNEKERTTLHIQWKSFFDDSEEVKKIQFLQSLSKQRIEAKQKAKKHKHIDKKAEKRIQDLLPQKKEKVKDEYMIGYMNDLSDDESDSD